MLLRSMKAYIKSFKNVRTFIMIIKIVSLNRYENNFLETDAKIKTQQALVLRNPSHYVVRSVISKNDDF